MMAVEIMMDGQGAHSSRGGKEDRGPEQHQERDPPVFMREKKPNNQTNTNKVRRVGSRPALTANTRHVPSIKIPSRTRREHPAQAGLTIESSGRLQTKLSSSMCRTTCLSDPHPRLRIAPEEQEFHITISQKQKPPHRPGPLTPETKIQSVPQKHPRETGMSDDIVSPAPLKAPLLPSLVKEQKRRTEEENDKQNKTKQNHPPSPLIPIPVDDKDRLPL